MIKPNDLRIGNNFKYEHEVITLYGIEDKSVQILKPNMNNYFHKIPIDWIEPIELTEEILLKCGFVNEHDEIDGVYYDIFYVTNTDYLIEYCFEENHYFLVDEHALKIKVEHLHQLQNLYWCLCGKELNVNI